MAQWKEKVSQIGDELIDNNGGEIRIVFKVRSYKGYKEVIPTISYYPENFIICDSVDKKY